MDIPQSETPSRARRAFAGRSPRLRLIAWSCLALFLGAPAVRARPCRVELIPNGAVAGCLNCHLSIFGAGRNSFGKAVEPLVGVGDCLTAFWGPALAALDSDGDGRTNGEELGDPAGTWRPHDPPPGSPALVT